MKEKLQKLDRIREPDADVSLAASILSSILVVIFGAAVGLVSQAAIFFGQNSTVWWQDIVSDFEIDVLFSKFPVWFMFGIIVAVASSSYLKAMINEFCFFVGVCIGKTMLPRVFAEAAGPDDLGKWVLIAVISVPLAFIFWYAKSGSWPSIIFDVLIIGLMGAYLFDCGMIYFHFSEDFIMDLYNLAIFAVTFIAIASGVVQVVVTLVVGLFITLMLGPVI